MVTINVTIEDNEELNASIFIDGTLVTVANLYTWDTTTYPDGRHTIRAEVTDSGRLSDTESLEVIVDNEEDTIAPFDGTLKIMVYNIRQGGLNDDWKTIVKETSPDIIVLVETGYWEINSYERLNAEVSELNAYFADENPYIGYCSQDTYFTTTGEAILSRFPIEEFNQIGYVPLDDESEYDVTHDFIEAVVDINGTDVHVIGGHLKAAEGEDNQWRRDREMEGMINYMDNLGDVPILYLSDQNSYSPFDTGPLAPVGQLDLGVGPMTMMLVPDDPIYGNFSSTVHNFTDVFRMVNPSDPGHTYWDGGGIRIDYIIVNSFFVDMLCNSTVINVTPADTASDHYAVEAFLDWSGCGI